MGLNRQALTQIKGDPVGDGRPSGKPPLADLDNFVTRENVALLRKRLATAHDRKTRSMIVRLLSDEEHKRRSP
jgi:hypothetical protein